MPRQDQNSFRQFGLDRFGRNDVMRINQIRQPIRTENDHYQVTECNEFRMTHGEGTPIRQVELEGPKTVGGQPSQFVNVHTIKSSARRLCSSTGFPISSSGTSLFSLGIQALIRSRIPPKREPRTTRLDDQAVVGAAHWVVFPSKLASVHVSISALGYGPRRTTAICLCREKPP